MKVLLVPGARHRIDKMLDAAGIRWSVKNGFRITSADAMPIIRDAAFDAANTVMTALAGEHITAVIGNWVRARGVGVIDGTDYGSAGETDKLDMQAINTVLSSSFIPIFPCIGWNIAGKPYNISSLLLAKQVSEHIKADKLFYIAPNAEITRDLFTIPASIGVSPDGCVPSMNLEELASFMNVNRCCKIGCEGQMLRDKILSMLSIAGDACKNGVVRSHIVNGSLDGSLLREIFSDLGSGTMIYTSDYGGIRAMKREDVPGVLRVMNPFVKKGMLLQRTRHEILSQITDYIVYELDGGIRACASLHIYDSIQGEIAGVAVDESCAHIGIGLKIISFLIEKAKSKNLKSVFILTTQAADWFQRLGFVDDDISSVPEKRRKIWTPTRNSKVLRLPLD